MRGNGRRQAKGYKHAKGYKQQNYINSNTVDVNLQSVDEKLAALNRGAVQQATDTRTVEDKINETLKNSGTAREKVRVDDPSKLQVRGDEKVEKKVNSFSEVIINGFTFAGDKRSATVQGLVDFARFGSVKKAQVAKQLDQFPDNKGKRLFGVDAMGAFKK